MTLLIIFGILVAYLVVGVLFVFLFNHFDTKDPNNPILDDSIMAGEVVIMWPFGVLLCVASVVCILGRGLTKFLGRLSGRKD